MELRNRRLVIGGLFLAVALCLAYWVVARTINVYDNALVGALYELAWLPVIFLTFAVPVFSLFRWYKDRWRLSSPFLLIAVLAIAVVGYVTELI